MNCNPFKAFFLTLILGFISTLLMTNLAIASPFLGVANHPSSHHFLLAQTSDQQPAQENAQPKMAQPKPQIPSSEPRQTTDQSTDTPSSLQKEEPTDAKAKDAKSGGPYDMKAIEEFYKSLYGS